MYLSECLCLCSMQLGIVTWKGAIATFIGYVVVCFIIIAFYVSTHKCLYMY